MQWVIFYNLKCPIGLLGQVYNSTNNPPQIPSHRLKSCTPAMTPVWSSFCRRAITLVSGRYAGWPNKGPTQSITSFVCYKWRDVVNWFIEKVW